MRKKSIVRRLLPWVIVLGAIAALVIFVYVPIYTREGKSFSRPTEVFFYRDGSGTAKMENEYLKFELDRDTTTFKVTNKDTGKVWYSNPPDRDKDEIAGGTLKEWLSSTLLITYWDEITKQDINNYTKSIKNECYRISQEEENGTIRVDYAIGEIHRQFLIPEAITEERYKEFQKGMSSKQKAKVGNIYTKIGPDNINSKSNKDEYLRVYPSVATQTLYIIKDDKEKVNERTKGDAEEAFAAAGYNQEEYETDMQLVAGEREKYTIVFNVSVYYRLDGKDLIVEIPYSEVTCNSDYPLTDISILPVFGAGGINDEGYMVVPEGGGSLIRFNNGKIWQESYYSDLFGWDYYKKKDSMKNETEAAFEVFGISHEGDAPGSFICIMEGANSYGHVVANVSGRLNQYNDAYAQYNVLHYDSMDSMGRNPSNLQMYEARIPEDTIVQRYRFIDESGYMAMANAYGDYLRKNKGIKEETIDSEMPVNIELVGAIDKKVVKYGVLVEAFIPVTGFSEAQDILSEFSAKGISNLSMRYTGWSNGGVRQKVLSSVHTLNELGGDKAMKELILDAKEKGVDLYFDGISCFAYNSDLSEGFVAFEHAAHSTTNEVAKRYPYDIVTFKPSDWMEPYYIMRPKYAKEYASNLIKALDEKEAAGVAFRDIGNLLIADYNERDLVTREQVKAMNVETLQEARDAGLKISIKEGNEYALPYADLITDMDLSGSSYAILDENIPFYQIAIHGLKSYTGEAINLAGDYQNELLECAAYGAGLNFTFMNADTKVLQDSYYSCYASAGYGPWKEQVMDMISRYQKEMSGLNSEKIVGFENLTDQISVTTYENGAKVYVNYSEHDFEAGNDIIVPARDYYVDRGDVQ